METGTLFDQISDVNSKYATDPRTLYRRNSSDTSQKAAHSLNVTLLEEMVLTAIEHSANNGVTQDELIQMFPEHSYSSITARPSALKRKGLIFDSGERRKGRSGRSQAVLKAAKYRASEKNV